MPNAFGSQPPTNYGSTANSGLPGVNFAGGGSTHSEGTGLLFSPTELYNLSDNITTNIYTVNHAWRTLDHTVRLLGTDRDNPGLRDKVHVTQLSCNQIVAQTTKDLQRLTEIVRKGDKQQRLQVEKLTNDFKEAVQVYSRLQKQVAERMKVSLLAQREYTSNASEEEYNNEAATAAVEARHQQITLQREVEFDQGLLLEREARIRQIEADVLDVNQIMRELSAMVHIQGENINSIENNIENVNTDVELGARELEKAAEYQSKYRRKLCFLISLALIVIIVLTTILVVELKR